MFSSALLRGFTAFRRLLYNTPIRHWKITAAASGKLTQLIVGRNRGETMQIDFRGGHFAVPTNDTSMVGSLIAQTYEAGTLNLFQAEVRKLADAATATTPRARFVDVGANIGLFSVLAARESSGRLHIDAFEPDPKTASLLAANLRLNECASVTVHEMAVGQSPGTAVLDNRSPLLGNHHLSQSTTMGIPVRVTALDHFFADDLESVKLIKIDVEGFEPDVIAGAREVIRRASPTVFLEFLPLNLKQGGHRPEDFLQMLQQMFPFVASLDEVTGAVTPVSRDSSAWPRRLLSVGANLVLHF